jgi:hypothetical protein
MSKDNIDLVYGDAGHETLEYYRNKSDGFLGRHYPIVYATADDPIHNFGIDVDLNKLQFSGTTQVEHTLGVSQQTYGWLALLGAVGASGLGSGWLLKLLGLFVRPRSRKMRSTDKEQE